MMCTKFLCVTQVSFSSCLMNSSPAPSNMPWSILVVKTKCHQVAGLKTTKMYFSHAGGCEVWDKGPGSFSV